MLLLKIVGRIKHFFMISCSSKSLSTVDSKSVNCKKAILCNLYQCLQFATYIEVVLNFKLGSLMIIRLAQSSRVGSESLAKIKLYSIFTCLGTLICEQENLVDEKPILPLCFAVLWLCSSCAIFLGLSLLFMSLCSLRISSGKMLDIADILMWGGGLLIDPKCRTKIFFKGVKCWLGKKHYFPILTISRRVDLCISLYILTALIFASFTLLSDAITC